MAKHQVHAIRVREADGGGHIVTHEYESTGGDYKTPEEHVFTEPKKMIEHLQKHIPGIDMTIAKLNDSNPNLGLKKKASGAKGAGQSLKDIVGARPNASNPGSRANNRNGHKHRAAD